MYLGLLKPSALGGSSISKVGFKYNDCTQIYKDAQPAGPHVRSLIEGPYTFPPQVRGREDLPVTKQRPPGVSIF